MQPYYDEALAALQAGYEGIPFWWATHTLHELYRIKDPVFRSRIPQDAAGNTAVVEMITRLHLDSIRYSIKDEDMWAITEENLTALNRKPMSRELQKAKNANVAWVKLTDICNQYIRAGTPSERGTKLREMTGLCARLDSCSAVDMLVNRTVEMLQAVERSQNFGGGIWHQTVDFETGQRSEVTSIPTLQETEWLGVNLLAALGRPILTECLEGLDYSIDPEREGGNYKILLDKAFQLLS